MTSTLNAAQAMIERARAHATSVDVPMNIAVTEIMKGQFDPQEMIDKMVAVIGADDGKYRNVWPPSIEDLIKQVQETLGLNPCNRCRRRPASDSWSPVFRRLVSR